MIPGSKLQTVHFNPCEQLYITGFVIQLQIQCKSSVYVSEYIALRQTIHWIINDTSYHNQYIYTKQTSLFRCRRRIQTPFMQYTVQNTTRLLYVRHIYVVHFYIHNWSNLCCIRCRSHAMSYKQWMTAKYKTFAQLYCHIYSSQIVDSWHMTWCLFQLYIHILRSLSIK